MSAQTITIRVTPETKQELDTLGRKNQTYDDLVGGLIRSFRKTGGILVE